MASPIVIRCFLCRQKTTRKGAFKSVVSSVCPVSKKKIKDVLQYLARLSKTEMHIRDESLCMSCYDRIVEYDTAVVRTLRKQRTLSLLVEKAVTNVDVDSDFEEECNRDMSTMKELNDMHCFDDINVSESEISQTMDEAMGRRKRFKEQKNSPQRGFSLRHRLPKISLQCGFCAMQFKSKMRLHKHISRAHKKFSCELCTFSHRNEDYVKLHMNKHEGRTENQCRFCEKEFTTKISTIRHMEVHFDSKKYQCDKCGLCFSQTTVLYNHKLQHEAEEQPLRCEICDQMFKTKRTYRHHMITHRADRPRYSCEYCEKTFTEKYTLKVHKRTHPEVSENPKPRAQSQQITNLVVTPVAEPAAAPTAETKVNCIICDQSYANKEHLNKHMEKEHDVILQSLTLTNFSQNEVVTNESKRPCHVCGHMFRTQTNLNHHLEHMHGVAFK